MKNKTTWAIVGLLAAFVLILAINALIVWAITTYAILPIAAAMGYDLPFWPVFILLWVATSFISSLFGKRNK